MIPGRTWLLQPLLYLAFHLAASGIEQHPFRPLPLLSLDNRADDFTDPRQNGGSMLARFCEFSRVD